MERREDRGPFDIIGDIHGCAGELGELLERLGYVPADNGAADELRHPEGRRVIFLGDLVDRGPDSAGVLRRAMAMVASGQALCLPGNHDDKLLCKLRDRNLRVAHGLAETLAQLEREPQEFRAEVSPSWRAFPATTCSMSCGWQSPTPACRFTSEPRDVPARDFALYGETTRATDAHGSPERVNWALRYRGRATMVHGHTPMAEPRWLHNTINIDIGCVFDVRLTVLRYPERTLVSAGAKGAYANSTQPFLAPAPSPNSP